MTESGFYSESKMLISLAMDLNIQTKSFVIEEEAARVCHIMKDYDKAIELNKQVLDKKSDGKEKNHNDIGLALMALINHLLLLLFESKLQVELFQLSSELLSSLEYSFQLSPSGKAYQVESLHYSVLSSSYRTSF